MSKGTTSRCLGALLLTGTLVSAQNISGDFSPSVATPGAPVTFTATDAVGQGFYYFNPCNWFTIHQGTQAGPVVPHTMNCVTVILEVDPHGSVSWQWNQIDASTGQQVSPGEYWFHAHPFDGNGNQLYSEWFCLTIQPASAPTTVETAPIRLGQTTPFNITSPAHPNEPYAVLLSFDSNAPIVVPGFLELCLSAPIFTAGVGTLDPSGTSNAFSLPIPAAPFLAYQGFHLQTVIVDLTGGELVPTNDVSVSILP